MWTVGVQSTALQGYYRDANRPRTFEVSNVMRSEREVFFFESELSDGVELGL
jgi:hypothetical protein